MTTTAFLDVNVVPMDRERVLARQTVVVRDAVIAAVGRAAEVRVPEEATRIDARDRYLLPGLADMHVHLEYEEDLLLFLANGVTTVRNMSGAPFHVAWRERVARGEMLGPTIITAGPIIDGKPPTARGAVVVETTKEAARVVAEQAAAGYDFVKIYDGLSRDSYDALMAAASRLGVSVAGHVSRNVRLRRALASRQWSIEHLSGYVDPIEAADSPFRGKWNWRKTWHAVEVDDERIARAATATRDAGVWNCPTLVVFEKAALRENAQSLLERPEMRYIRAERRASWGLSDGRTPVRTTAPARREVARAEATRRGEAVRKKLTKALADAGAGILLGTDAANRFVLPGFSVHEELRCLVAAGLTPYEAIRAGTRAAAESLERGGEFGTVEAGKRADLILLEANPLDDVDNVQRRQGVMARGRWLPQAEIRAMLEQMAASLA